MSFRKVFVKIKSWSWSGFRSGFHFEFQYQNYILYIRDTKFCLNPVNPSKVIVSRQTDRQTLKIKIRIRIRISLWNFIQIIYALYIKDAHKIWERSARLLSNSKSWSWSGFWSKFHIDTQYQNYILFIEDTHQILFRSAYSCKSCCVHRQIDRQTEIFFACFGSQKTCKEKKKK